MTSPVIIAWPRKTAERLGDESAQEIVDLINQAIAAVSAAKVDKTEYDAHTALINERFDRNELKLDALKTEMRAEIRGALLKGLAWVTGLIFAAFGGLLYSIVHLPK